MTLTTRRPTGKPSWPVLLIAGAEKAGKSWSCAQASASPKIGRTLWVSVGETDPDEYAAIPGADFEIVEHDGTIQGILSAVREISTLPQEDQPTLLVIDSMTRLWELITDNAQAAANKRRGNRSGEAQITMDLWNKAKSTWGQFLKAALAHTGPVLLTSRLEAVTVMDNDGKPTGMKTDKIRAEKNLPYEVDGVVLMHQRGQALLTGVRSATLQLDKPRPMPDFTVDGLWDMLGLTEVVPRNFSHTIETDGVFDDVQPGQQQRPPAQTRPQGQDRQFGIGANVRPQPEQGSATARSAQAQWDEIGAWLDEMGKTEGPAKFAYVQQWLNTQDTKRTIQSVANLTYTEAADLIAHLGDASREAPADAA